MLVIVPCWDGAVKTEVRRSGSGADGGQLGEVVAQGGLEAQQVVNELSRLSEVGVTEAAIPGMANEVVTGISRLLDTNPRDMSADDVAALYREVL